MSIRSIGHIKWTFFSFYRQTEKPPQGADGIFKPSARVSAMRFHAHENANDVECLMSIGSNGHQSLKNCCTTV